LSRIDPELVLFEPQMLERVVGGGVAQERFALLLIASFAALALVLAAIGLYGVLSHSVRRRTPEMGIRLALGATPRSIRSMVMRDAGRLAAAGIVLGFAGAFAATKLLRGLLFEVSATEPLAFGGAAAILAVVAVMASWVPAGVATKVDPLDAVRN
jgi:putative ABC transport system permease protein